MAFCGGRLGPKPQNFGAAGRNPLRRELASTLTSRSTKILDIFVVIPERHVSGDAPNRAHFLFMYSGWPVQGFGRVQKRENCALFLCMDMVSAIQG